VPVGPSTYELIRQAMLERQQVEAVYDGHRRRLCPHVIGTAKGEQRALFFQFAGTSSRGLPPGGDWRCLSLARLSEVVVRDGSWHSRPHSRPQHCVEQVDLEIEG